MAVGDSDSGKEERRTIIWEERLRRSEKDIKKCRGIKTDRKVDQKKKRKNK